MTGKHAKIISRQCLGAGKGKLGGIITDFPGMSVKFYGFHGFYDFPRPANNGANAKPYEA
jgi:hypothetical protein